MGFTEEQETFMAKRGEAAEELLSAIIDVVMAAARDLDDCAAAEVADKICSIPMIAEALRLCDQKYIPAPEGF